MTDFELYNINGGALNWSAALFNSFSRGLETILDLGRSFGTALRMWTSKRSC